MSKISWTNKTWNVCTGCDPISQSCKWCYAKELSNRLCAMGQVKYRNKFVPTIHPDELNRITKWKKPRTIFVNSMSDLFHDDFMETGFIQQVFSVMNNNPQHTFQVLTKRVENAIKLSSQLLWSDNIWMGASIENNNVLDRVLALKSIPARHKFLSIEPLLGALPDLDLSGIDWCIVGGLTGRGSFPLNKDWVYPIKDQCNALSIPFFFKQMGGSKKNPDFYTLDGAIYRGIPPQIIL